MAEVMDLDLSLEEIAKKRNGGNKRGRGRGGRGGAQVNTGGPGRVASTLKNSAPRAAPYVSNPEYL